MRLRYRFLCASLGLGMPLAAQAQQPFEKLGVMVKVLSLSNGRYPEYFPNDSLRRIGTVVYNTRLKRVAYLLPGDSLVGRVKSEVTSRWLTVDPLAEKFAHISPYVYVENNPVRYMDPDGRELVDPNGQRVTVGKDGSFVYAGKDASIITYVNALRVTEQGRTTLMGLVSTDTRVSINIAQGRGTGKGMGGEVEGLTRGKGDIVDKKTGKHVYESAKIEIFMGTLDAEHKNPRPTDKNANSSPEEYVNTVGTHEGIHTLEDLEVNRQTAAGCANCDEDQLEQRQFDNREANADRGSNASQQQYRDGQKTPQIPK